MCSMMLHTISKSLLGLFLTASSFYIQYLVCNEVLLKEARKALNRVLSASATGPYYEKRLPFSNSIDKVCHSWENYIGQNVH